MMSRKEYIDSLPLLYSDIIFNTYFGDDNFYIIETIYYNNVKKILENVPENHWNNNFKGTFIPVESNWLIVFNDTTLRKIDFCDKTNYLSYNQRIVKNIKDILNNSSAKKKYIDSIIDYHSYNKEELGDIMSIIAREVDNGYDLKLSNNLFDSLIEHLRTEINNS